MIFPRPRILVSRCLGFDACRYNGERLHHVLTDQLLPFADVVTVCPEVDMGMTVPRDPIRVIEKERTLRLIQPSTGKDYTATMTTFSTTFLDDCGPLDGAILKSRSPSCGVSDTKYFSHESDTASQRRGAGLFARAFKDRFPILPVEDDQQLLKHRRQDQLLTAVYIWADFRTTVLPEPRENLVQFHTRNKFLFMARHQSILKTMDRLVADYTGEVNDLERYQKLLATLLSKAPRIGNQVKVLRYFFGRIAKVLTPKERIQFNHSLYEFHAGRGSVHPMRKMLETWSRNSDESDLQFRRFFEPYPPQLNPWNPS